MANDYYLPRSSLTVLNLLDSAVDQDYTFLPVTAIKELKIHLDITASKY